MGPRAPFFILRRRVAQPRNTNPSRLRALVPSFPHFIAQPLRNVGANANIILRDQRAEKARTPFSPASENRHHGGFT